MSHVRFFHALADETRLRMIVLLAGEGEVAVGELVTALALSQPKVSRHLAHLRKARIVEVRRRAQWVLYRLSDMLEPWQRHTIATVRKGLCDCEPFRTDAARLPRRRAKTEPAAPTEMTRADTAPLASRGEGP